MKLDPAQQALVAAYAKSSGHPYQVPQLLEGAVSILMHHAKHGEPLYNRNPVTYTRCQESGSRYPTAISEAS